MDQIVLRIGKLLVKAERTDSVDEAEALFAKAQRLASRHSVEWAVARRAQVRTEARQSPEERTVVMGAAGQHHVKQFAALFLVVAEANDVKCLIASNSTTMYPVGFPADLDVTEAIYLALVEQMARFGGQWVRAGQWKQERYRAGYDRWGTMHTKPMTARVARRLFYEGFTAEIRQRLLDARQSVLDEAEAAFAQTQAEHDRSQVSVTTLALREKKAEVNEFYAAKIKRDRIRSSWRGSATLSTRGASSEAGRTAGMSASLSGAKQVKSR